jgi:heme-dependent oxidative N-demethylase alpha subunit-like protein
LSIRFSVLSLKTKINLQRYLPFLNGKYSTAPGLISKKKTANENSLVFQIDENYFAYLKNKEDCRRENIHKYFIEHELPGETIAAINRYMLWQMSVEYPGNFTYDEQTRLLKNKLTKKEFVINEDLISVNGDEYLSVFDMLCSQLQEDFAICCLSEQKDWLAAIHLCAPNHWAAADKIGKPFDAVHAPVPDMEKTKQNYLKILLSVIEKGPFTRFAWGIATDNRLNHHPDAPDGMNEDYWHGRKTDTQNPKFYLRVERQNLVGFSAMNAFLFSIRTYFYSIEELENEEKRSLLMALESMSAATLNYKGLNDKIGTLRSLLF